MALAVRRAGIAPTLNKRGAGQHEEGAQALAAAQAGIAHGIEHARLAAPRPCGSRRSMVCSVDCGGKGQRRLELRGTTTTAWDG